MNNCRKLIVLCACLMALQVMGCRGSSDKSAPQVSTAVPKPHAAPTTAQSQAKVARIAGIRNSAKWRAEALKKYQAQQH